MKRIVLLSFLSLGASFIFCADEIARRIREEWDRLEYALPGGNYSDIHRFHERIAAFMGEACYGKLQRQSHVFGETVDGTYDLMRDELRINFNGLASALKKVLNDYVAFNEIWQNMQSRYEEIYRLGVSVWEEEYLELDIAKNLDALVRLCSEENDQMLEQVDQIKEAAKNLLDSIDRIIQNTVLVFQSNAQKPQLIDHINTACNNILNPVDNAVLDIIRFLEEYEQAMGQEDGEEVYEEAGSEEEANDGVEMVLPVRLG